MWVHPCDMTSTDVEPFLTHLAVRRQVSASTQNHALNALVFLYRDVLRSELGDFKAVRARRPIRLPTVLSPAEARRVLLAMDPAGVHVVMAGLLYGSGLRLLECSALRVMDLDLERGQITVPAAKGDKDRAAPLPLALRDPLRT